MTNIMIHSSDAGKMKTSCSGAVNKLMMAMVATITTNPIRRPSSTAPLLNLILIRYHFSLCTNSSDGSNLGGRGFSAG